MAKIGIEIADALNKAYKKEVVTTANTIPPVFKIPIMNPSTDYCLDGGIPIGRMIEFYGEYSSGKTLNAILAAVQFQRTDWASLTPNAIQKVTTDKKSGELKFEMNPKYSHLLNPISKYVGIVDAEGTFDAAWAEYQGLDTTRVLYSCPETMEAAIDITASMLRDPTISLVIFDSLRAMGVEVESEKGMEQRQMGANSMMWTKAFRMFQSALNANRENRPTLLFLNGTVTNIGQMHGDPVKPAGGKAPAFAKSISIRFNQLKEETEGDDVLGRFVSVKGMKNKVGIQGRKASYYHSLVSKDGQTSGKIDFVQSLFEISNILEVLERSGHSYRFGSGVKIVGAENFKNHLRSDKNELDALTDLVYERLRKI